MTGLACGALVIEKLEKCLLVECPHTRGVTKGDASEQR